MEFVVFEYEIVSVSSWLQTIHVYISMVFDSLWFLSVFMCAFRFQWACTLVCNKLTIRFTAV